MAIDEVQVLIDELTAKGWSEQDIQNLLNETQSRANRGVAEPLLYSDPLDKPLFQQEIEVKGPPSFESNNLSMSLFDGGVSAGKSALETHQGESPVVAASRRREIPVVDKTLISEGNRRS